MLVSFSAMLTIMDRDALEELFDIYGQITFVDGNDLYAPSEEEIVEQLTALLDKPITDQQADALLGKAAVILVLAFAVLAAGIAAAIASEKGCKASEVKASEVQSALRKLNVKLHLEEVGLSSKA